MLAAPAVVLAQYKCVAPSGAVSFQQLPCPGASRDANAESGRLPPAPPPPEKSWGTSTDDPQVIALRDKTRSLEARIDARRRQCDLEVQQLRTDGQSTTDFWYRPSASQAAAREAIRRRCELANATDQELLQATVRELSRVEHRR